MAEIAMTSLHTSSLFLALLVSEASKILGPFVPYPIFSMQES